MCSHADVWIRAEMSIGAWWGLRRQLFSPIFATKGHVTSAPARLMDSPPALLRLPCTKPRSIWGSYRSKIGRFVFFPSKWYMFSILGRKGQNQDSNSTNSYISPFLLTFTTQLSHLQPWTLANWLCYRLWSRSSLWLRYISLPFSLSSPNYISSSYRELQHEGHVLMYFNMSGKNQIQTCIWHYVMPTYTGPASECQD